jgi:CRISPR type IV-associated protein Csf2
MTIAGVRPTAAESDQSSGSVSVPIIPASTVAGKLRRAAADLIGEAFVARELTLTPRAFNMMMTGSASTSLNVNSASPEVHMVARADPFMSMFGGTIFALPASTTIAQGWPLLDLTQDMFMSPPIGRVDQYTHLREMTDAYAIVKKNDAMDMHSSLLPSLVKLDTLCAYTEEESAERASAKAKKDAGESGKKTDLRTLNAMEVVRPGISFGIRVRVDSRNPGHLGLMVLSLQRFLNSRHVGGHTHRGMGRFVAADQVRIYSIDPYTWEVLHEEDLFKGHESNYALCGSEVLDEAIEQADLYLNVGAKPELFEAFAGGDYEAIKGMYRHG